MTTEPSSEPLRLEPTEELSGGTMERQQERGVSLSLEIPVDTHTGQPSASTSSEPSSPNPLTDSDTLIPKNSISETPPSSTSTHTGSTSSLPTTTSTTRNVKFAPLPQIPPRRRRSTAPLGMAARGQLMRRRRGHYADQQLENEKAAVAANGMWTQEELEEQRLKQEEMAARYAHYQASAAARAAREEEAKMEEEEEEAMEIARRNHDMERLRRIRGPDDAEDRLLALRKTMKGLWKKVSHKDGELLRDKNKDKTTKEEPIGVRPRRKSDITRPVSASAPSSPAVTSPPFVLPPVPPLPSASILSSSPIDSLNNDKPEGNEDGGQVWEEEIDKSFPLNVSQTETVVEGRPVRPSGVSKGSSTVDLSSTPVGKKEEKIISILKTSRTSSPVPPSVSITSKASRTSLSSSKP